MRIRIYFCNVSIAINTCATLFGRSYGCNLSFNFICELKFILIELFSVFFFLVIQNVGS